MDPIVFKKSFSCFVSYKVAQHLQKMLFKYEAIWMIHYSIMVNSRKMCLGGHVNFPE